MGITLREVIYDIGGGLPDNKKFKAVLVGGPSGGCLPDTMLDLAIDYESLVQAGAIMGSGGLVVIDEETCMVDTAKFFIDFCVDESCGKCTPCRVGLHKIQETYAKIIGGLGKPEDIQFLRNICAYIKDSSLCGLGQTAPNPVLTTLRYFANEYNEHIFNKKCEAGKCSFTHDEKEEEI
jgi:NADH:ubiquinone oxidoreductase subunit F (NADH-binding)